MNYTLSQLAIFVKIAETHSITRAAEELHLTQPAVSIQLKKLQEQFDVPLTEIIGRKLYVTDFGWEIAATAREILDQLEEINYKTEAYKGLLTGKLRVSVVSTGKYVMPYFLSGFIQQHPGVDLNMDVTNKSSVVKSLKDNSVDFSLVSVLPDNLLVGKIDLIQNKLFLVGDTSEQFDKKWYSTKMLEKLPLIFREKGSGTRRTTEEFLSKNDLHVNTKMELTSNEAVKQAVLAGLGYSILPLIGLSNELRINRLQIIPIRGFPIKSTWMLVWPEGKKHSPLVKEFFSYLEEEKEQIIDRWFRWYEDY